MLGHGNEDALKIAVSDKTNDDASKVVDQLSKGADTGWGGVFRRVFAGGVIQHANQATGDYGVRGVGETTQDVRNKVAEKYGDEKNWTDKQKAIIAEFDKRIKAEGGPMDLQKGYFQVASTMQAAGGGDVLSAVNRVDSLDAIKDNTARSAQALETLAANGGGSSSGTPAPSPPTDIAIP
jgi:hypothetical protein